MDAEDRQEVLELIRREMYAMFFGTASGGVTSGEQDGTGRAGEQLGGVPIVQHYGFKAEPPDGTERLYAETQAGLVSIGERSTSAPSLTAGQAALHDANGSVVKVTNASGAARRVEIGKGGTYKDAARKGDAADPPALLLTWLKTVGGVTGAGDPPGNGSYTITSGSGTVGIED